MQLLTDLQIKARKRQSAIRKKKAEQTDAEIYKARVNNDLSITALSKLYNVSVSRVREGLNRYANKHGVDNTLKKFVPYKAAPKEEEQPDKKVTIEELYGEDQYENLPVERVKYMDALIDHVTNQTNIKFKDLRNDHSSGYSSSLAGSYGLTKV